jgi:alanine dehydrogenase
MVRVYSADEVHAALPWAKLAAALEAAFKAGADVPVRHAHSLGHDDTLLLMPAWNADVLGTKLVTVMPRNASHAAGTVQATYLLMDRATGEPRALLDGEALTLRRTAATSALAARHLARGDASRLLVVGTGRLAEWMVRAHVALQPGLTQVMVWGRRTEAAQTLAARLAAHQELAFAQVLAVPDLAAAIARCDVITCATTSTEPIIQGAWLRHGQHLDLVGGFKPSMREADAAAVLRSSVVVDTYGGALKEAGELQGVDRHNVHAELAEVLRGERRGRTNLAQITLFKSVGTALEDLAAAACVVGPQA